MPFRIEPSAMSPRMVAGEVPVQEGRFTGGFYQVINTDLNSYNAELRVPPEFDDAATVEGWSQAMPQGRLLDGPQKDAIMAKGAAFKTLGGAEMQRFAAVNPGILFMSDATNYPFNEGHFVIKSGKVLPLTPRSQPVKGRHYIMSISKGRIDFPVVDMDRPTDVASVESGFFVPKIIDEGKAISLLDPVPGTGNISISDYRGHIGQIFNEGAYSEQGSQRRVDIHSQILRYLRDPRNYMFTLQNIVNGASVDFGKYGQVSFPMQTFNHTYWIETMGGELFCVKTYPAPDGKSPAGVTFKDGPHLLFALARQYDFTIRNAFIGTNGKDIRLVEVGGGQARAVDTALDGVVLRNFKFNPVANFLAFSRKPKG